MQSSSENQSGMGCFAKGCLTVVVIFLAVLVGLYYLAFHTPWPANMFKKLVTAADSPLEIGKISGSIRSGFSVDSMSFAHTNGNVSSFEDVGFRFKRIKHGLQINDIHVKSAHLYLDWKDPSSTREEFSVTSSSNTHDGSSTPYAFVITQIDINDVRIENPRTKEVVQVDVIHLNGFKTTHIETRIGKLTIKSPSLDFSIVPTGDLDKKGLSTTFSFSGIVKPSLSTNILQTLTFEGEVDMGTEDSSLRKFSALDGLVSLQDAGESGDVRLVARDFTPRDYIRTAFPISHINADITTSDDSSAAPTIRTASFRIAETEFTGVEFTQTAEDASTDNYTLVARAKTELADYTCLIGADDQRLVLKTEPEMSTQDAVATLLGGAKYAALDAAGRQKVDEAMHFFESTEGEPVSVDEY